MIKKEIILVFVLLLFSAGFVSAADNESTSSTIDSSEEIILSEDNVLSLPKTIRPSGNTFEDIEKAINEADEGDIIELEGIYTSKEITICSGKSVTLQSSSKGATIDGADFYGIQSYNNIIFKNITFVNVSGIYCYGNCSINDCVFKSNSNLNIYGKSSLTSSLFSDINVNLKNFTRINGCEFSNTNINMENCTLNNSKFNNSVLYLFESQSAVISNSSFLKGDLCLGSSSSYDEKFTLSDVKFNSTYTYFYGNIIMNNILNYDTYIAFEGICSLNTSNFKNGGLSSSGSISGKNKLQINKSSFNNCEIISDNIESYGNDFSKSGLWSIEKSYIYDSSLSKTSIRSDSNCYVRNSQFNGNTNINPNGGGIYSKGTVYVLNSQFSNNNAKDYGGAIYSHKTCTIINSNFTNTHSNEKGGAVYSNSKLIIRNSSFTKCSSDDEGGAVYSNKNCTVENSIFNNNIAKNNGGAIYSNINLIVSNSTFKNNKADYKSDKTNMMAYGGAIYASKNKIASVSNSIFTSNSAGYGGAIEGLKIISNCTFKNNFAKYYGGALYNVKSITNSKFNNNKANWGGAIANSENLKISTSVFTGNNAKYGGTIYLEEFNTASVIKSAFKNNKGKYAGILYTITYNDMQYGEGTTTFKDCSFTNNEKESSLASICSESTKVSITKNGKTKKFSQTIPIKDNLKIKKTTPKIYASKKTFKAKTKSKIYETTLKNNRGSCLKNIKLTLKIKGKTYTAKTNKFGKATFKIKLTKKGTYKAKVTFKGNSYYNKITKNVNIKIR